MTISDVDTPALLLDFDKLDRNLDKMAALARERRVALRPHAKTHKTPVIAQLQVDRGAVGICCAKLGEAEVMVADEIRDVLITTEIVGRPKIERLIALAQKANIAIVVDDAAAAGDISAACVHAGIQLRCFIDVNVGQNRTGVAPGEPAAGLAAAVANEPGLIFAGLQGYEGHLQHIVHPNERQAANARAMQALVDTAARIAKRGLQVELITTGGTGTAAYASTEGYPLEIQPGSYTVMDAQYGATEGVDFEHALTILTTVISVHDHRVIVDAGLKAASTDAGMARPVGQHATYAPGGDEHGVLSGIAGARLGMQIELIPGHCDTTINLYNEYVVHRGGEVIDRWPVAARGKLQ
ncbi:MAG TPA: DSD1 family PLP-dependent enzyme [Candidatus Binatia bacterium]|nr:DSD1 family PLP-dependent enzyme [Candidatus Binatia bacterium]